MHSELGCKKLKYADLTLSVGVSDSYMDGAFIDIC